MAESIPLLRLQVFLLKYHLQLLAGTFVALLLVLFSMVSTSLNLRGQVVPPVSACADQIDNDGDGRSDYPPDLGCPTNIARDEWQDAECFDGKDNDRDGAVDFGDFGCHIVFNGERFPLARCEDNKDNDGDGMIDMADSGCSSAQDHSEN